MWDVTKHALLIDTPAGAKGGMKAIAEQPIYSFSGHQVCVCVCVIGWGGGCTCVNVSYSNVCEMMFLNRNSNLFNLCKFYDSRLKVLQWTGRPR